MQRAKLRIRQPFLAVAFLLLLNCRGLFADETNLTYTGSASCRECHAPFYQLWAPSHHGLAMQPFRSIQTNLTAHTTEIRIGTNAYIADIAKGVVTERGMNGKKTYQIQEVMGGKNVFYFLTPLDRGRLQVLPLAYDVRRKEWFDTAASATRHLGGLPDESFHWTESVYTFNTSCYNCHVSQLTNHYDLKSDTYHTTWAEPGINCETCHGPASAHVQAARKTPKGKPLQRLELASFKNFDSEQINSLCGSCHAKTHPITASFSPGDRFYDHFTLATLDDPDFYPDGRDFGENFTITSWRLSSCIKSGKFNCITCHTSSGRYRFTGEKANDACMPCHENKVKDVTAHSHHKSGTQASECVACHMPVTEFARMRRTDHSMRPPMPASTMAFGSPNACTLCHTNKNAAWADLKVREWHKEDYQAPVLRRAALIAAARKGDWTKLPEMIQYLASPERQEIWAASLIRLLHNCELEAKWAGIVPCLKDRSPLVRATAVDTLADQLSNETLAPLLAATRDEYRLVRIRAANALAAVPEEAVPESERKALKAATDELMAAFFARPDDDTAHYNLGSYYLESRRIPEAIEAFKVATLRRPQDIAPWVNISMAYNLAGSYDLAEASLRRALKIQPTNAVVNLNLGMLLAEMNKLSDAEQAFRAAFKTDPKSAVAAFNLGMLLSKEHPADALIWCKKAADLRPNEPKYAYALAFFENENGRIDAAIQTLEKLIEHNPAHAESYALLVNIYDKQNKPAKSLSVLQRASENNQLTEQERALFLLKTKARSGK